MSALAALARTEWATKVAAEQAAAELSAAAALSALRTAAKAAVSAALRKQDGTTVAWADTGLRLKEEDIVRQRAIATDGVVDLIVRRQDSGDWVVHWGTWDGGPAWVQGERIRSVADLGRHLPAPEEP